MPKPMFVIYAIASTMQVGRTYQIPGFAARTCAHFNKVALGASKFGPGPYGWCSIEHYETKVVKMVERTNMMSGKKYMEASNTPGYCSPSSETYWSV